MAYIKWCTSGYPVRIMPFQNVIIKTKWRCIQNVFNYIIIRLHPIRSDLCVVYIALWMHININTFQQQTYSSISLYIYPLSHNHQLKCPIFTSRPFLKTAGGIVLGSVAVSAVSAVSADVLPYISVAIKASFLKLGMCNICKNNIAKMFLDFLKI